MYTQVTADRTPDHCPMIFEESWLVFNINRGKNPSPEARMSAQPLRILATHPKHKKPIPSTHLGHSQTITHNFSFRGSSILSRTPWAPIHTGGTHPRRNTHTSHKKNKS